MWAGTPSDWSLSISSTPSTPAVQEEITSSSSSCRLWRSSTGRSAKSSRSISLANCVHCSSSLQLMAIQLSSPDVGYPPWGANTRSLFPFLSQMFPLMEYSRRAGDIRCRADSAWDRSMYCPSPVRLLCSKAPMTDATSHRGAV